MQHFLDQLKRTQLRKAERSGVTKVYTQSNNIVTTLSETVDLTSLSINSACKNIW